MLIKWTACGFDGKPSRVYNLATFWVHPGFRFSNLSGHSLGSVETRVVRKSRSPHSPKIIQLDIVLLIQMLDDPNIIGIQHHPHSSNIIGIQLYVEKMHLQGTPMAAQAGIYPPWKVDKKSPMSIFASRPHEILPC